MRITVAYFAACREAVGKSTEDVEFSGNVTVGEVLLRLQQMHPRLARLIPTARVAVNQDFAQSTDALADGDELVILPPVSGGSGARAFLTEHAITSDAACKHVEAGGAGAMVSFSGVVRPTSKAGRAVTSLFYEAYQPMAQRKLQECLLEAHRSYPILDSAVVHRLGHLDLGDVAVSIAVCAAHRKEAFAACSFIIDRLKDIVPIWKKETGPDGTEWVSEGA